MTGQRRCRQPGRTWLRQLSKLCIFRTPERFSGFIAVSLLILNIDAEIAGRAQLLASGRALSSCKAKFPENWSLGRKKKFLAISTRDVEKPMADSESGGGPEKKNRGSERCLRLIPRQQRRRRTRF